MVKKLSIVCICLAMIVGLEDMSSQSPRREPDPLRVSLFKWVPSPKAIERIVEATWSAKHPDVLLEFVEWDGYEQDPPPDLDVFEYDAIFLEYMVRRNYAAPLPLDEIEDWEDISDFARRGCMVDGTLYGIPRIACTPVLFYRKGDEEIEKAESITDLLAVLGVSRDLVKEPREGRGLLIDLTGETTCSCFYLDAAADLSGEYSSSTDYPAWSHLDPDALRNVGLLTLMAGKKQALYENWDGQRARWFARGLGRAFIGWTERLSKMPVGALDQVSIRPLPLASGNTVNLLFVDLLSINSTLVGDRRRLAIEFANMAASAEVVTQSFLVKEDTTGSPQYLIPVRKSVLADPRLIEEAPLYTQLREIWTNAQTFRMNASARHWLRRYKGQIRSIVTSSP